MIDQSRLRNLLVEQLSGRHAHVDFKQAVDGLSSKEIGICPDGFPHSIWELVEHIRIAQRDILEFSRNPEYESPDWPDGYWPENQNPKNSDQWDKSVQAVQDDKKEMVELIKNPETDLLTPIEHGNGQTLFREAILIIDHNAYHIGQIVQLRRHLGSW